jgi:hypothetical protein
MMFMKLLVASVKKLRGEGCEMKQERLKEQ